VLGLFPLPRDHWGHCCPARGIDVLGGGAPLGIWIWMEFGFPSSSLWSCSSACCSRGLWGRAVCPHPWCPQERGPWGERSVEAPVCSRWPLWGRFAPLCNPPASQWGANGAGNVLLRLLGTGLQPENHGGQPRAPSARAHGAAGRDASGRAQPSPFLGIFVFFFKRFFSLLSLSVPIHTYIYLICIYTHI